MQSRRETFSTQVLLLVDALLIWIAFWLANRVRDPLFKWMEGLADSLFDYPMYNDPIGDLSVITWLLMIIVPFTPLVLERYGFYLNPLKQSPLRSLWLIVKGLLTMVLVVMLVSLAFKLPTSSRLVFGCGMAFSGALLFTRSELVRAMSRARASKGLGLERVLFAGLPNDIRRFREDLSADETAYWKVVGDVDLSKVGTKEFEEILESEAVEMVVFAVTHAEVGAVSSAIEICELQGVEAWVAVDFIHTQVARPTVDSIGSRPMLVLRSTPELSWELVGKWIIDRVGAFLLLLLTVWFWPLLAIGIKLAGPGPVFYRQRRAGLYGKPFTLWKLRTMHADAESRLREVEREHGNKMSGPVFKLEEDPRVFPFGRFLRRFSLDELPQLINVLRGEMSLVGPRPLPLYEAERIDEAAHRRRMSMRPGITCLWQVGGRNQVSDFGDWVALDLRYIDNWSLGLDLMILLKTVPAVLSRKGAS